jgi:hypothetical protein
MVVILKKRSRLKSTENRHSEFNSESHYADYQSLWEPETSSG